MTVKRLHRDLGSRHRALARLAQGFGPGHEHIAQLAPPFEKRLDRLAHVAAAPGEGVLGLCRSPAHLLSAGVQFLTPQPEGISHIRDALRRQASGAVEGFGLTLDQVAHLRQASQ
jgi:hypothetical protein